jgi:pimeloyl-ACP methyl ester carboxylesterase
MVLAHGGEGTRIHWWQQVAAFRRHFRCVTFDARGFGASPWGDVPASPHVQRDDLRGLLDHLGVDRAVLVGHSMGGQAVSTLAQEDPGRVRGLVMSATVFGFATAALGEWAAGMLEKIPAGFEVMDHLVTARFAERRPDLFYLYEALHRLNGRVRGPVGLQAYEGWRDQAVVDYRDFPVPTLFLVGTGDELQVPPLVRATAAAVGGSRLVEIQDAGHSIYAEQTEVYNRAILDFCAGLP